MAYVTPGTVAAGDVATAAAWNVITNDVISFRDGTGIVPPSASVAAANQAIANGTNTDLTFGSTATWDTNTMFSSGSPTRITIKTTGIYIISTQVKFFNGTTGFRYGALVVNASTTYVQFDLLTNTTLDPFEITSSEQLVLTANDFLTLRLYHTQGTSLSASGRMSATLLGRTT